MTVSSHYFIWHFLFRLTCVCFSSKLNLNNLSNEIVSSSYYPFKEQKRYQNLAPDLVFVFILYGYHNKFNSLPHTNLLSPSFVRQSLCLFHVFHRLSSKCQHDRLLTRSCREECASRVIQVVGRLFRVLFAVVGQSFPFPCLLVIVLSFQRPFIWLEFKWLHWAYPGSPNYSPYFEVTLLAILISSANSLNSRAWISVLLNNQGREA